ncbi:MAG TPA: patatin-like phospholipase family protein [Baekduia sp.]|nr:patatin-like phospholipase family protein [Baekduia sp.]
MPAPVPLRPVRRPPRVGVVLGAGGITGIAWLVGALEAVQRHTGWDPAEADIVSGTSAGAVAAAVLTSGVGLRSLLPYADDDVLGAAVRRAMADREPDRGGAAWPASLPLGVAGLTAGSAWRRAASVTGFLPAGRRPTDEIRGLVHEAAGRGWPSHTQLWLHACDAATGRRVTFGRAGAPDAELSCAVAASAAVPAWYRPVTIGGRRYIDGGVTSLTNADALVDAGCDVVVCLTPFAARRRESLLGTAVLGPARAVASLRLAHEARLLREAGARVVTVEPGAEELRVMGLNPMERRHSREVVEVASEGVGRRVAQLFADVALPRAPHALAA